MKIQRRDTTEALGCLVLAGERYLNHDIHIYSSAAFNAYIYVQLANETPSLEYTFVGAALHAIQHKNFNKIWIYWENNLGNLTTVIRQYNPVGD